MDRNDTFADRFAALEARIERDPQGLKKEMMEAARRDNPRITEAHLEAQWDYVARLFDIDA